MLMRVMSALCNSESVLRMVNGQYVVKKDNISTPRRTM